MPPFCKRLCVPTCFYNAHRWTWNKTEGKVCDRITNSSLNRTPIQIGIRLYPDLPADVSGVTKRFHVQYNLLNCSSCHKFSFRTPMPLAHDTGLDMRFWLLRTNSRRHEAQLHRPTTTALCFPSFCSVRLQTITLKELYRWKCKTREIFISRFHPFIGHKGP